MKDVQGTSKGQEGIRRRSSSSSSSSSSSGPFD
eukprot:CAMPEP_0206478944 /NCGR_PEP_ID=MMETSP0324_2-20121206/36389_1 /ASSEMBLY_ACC=CAM_ASM_000836 /TAXON_ID=2866 /ORGANISM="Crypthecodinium cohnii, Strain Seligo" /LENGTH=32 /DNA_ID= /DNA_START= /DNA_END= /DNA_ORIENTATION=